MSNKPKFDMSVNLGHIIIAGTMIASVAGAWSNLNTRMEMIEESVKNNTSVTNKFDVFEEKLDNIQSDISEIKTRND